MNRKTNKKAEVAVSIVWIARFLLVIMALAFIAFIAARLTTIKHDTFALDSKRQTTNAFLELSWTNPATGEQEVGVLDKKKVEALGERRDQDWPRALAQQYTIQKYSTTGLQQNDTFYVNKNKYTELEPLLNIKKGNAQSYTKTYYLHHQDGDQRIPILVKVITLAKKD